MDKEIGCFRCGAVCVKATTAGIDLSLSMRNGGLVYCSKKCAKLALMPPTVDPPIPEFLRGLFRGKL